MPAPEDDRHPWWREVNPIIRTLLGITGTGVLLRGHDGTRRGHDRANTTTSGNYLVDVQSRAAGGLHAAFVLSGTSPTAAPTTANSAALITDAGIALGTTARLEAERLRVYEAGRVDYSELTSADGELLLAGAGANAGGLMIGPGKALRILEASGGDYPTLTSADGELLLGGVGAYAGWASGNGLRLALIGAPASAPAAGTARYLASTGPHLYQQAASGAVSSLFDSSYFTAAGQLPYGAAANTLGVLAAGTSTQRLHGGPTPRWGGQEQAKTAATSQSTTSTTFVTIPDDAGGEMALTMTTTGGSLLALYTAVMSNSAANGVNALGFRLDAADTTDLLAFAAYVGGAYGAHTIGYLWTGVAAGAHTVRARWRVNAGTASTFGRVLSVLEL